MPHADYNVGWIAMKGTGLLLTILLFAPLTGCLSDYQISDECIITTDADDNTLTIITYDIIALSDEVLEEFTNQTGYEIKMIRADDSGGILENLLLTKEAPQADLALGLDNTYLQTALENCLLAPHSADLPNIDPFALTPYSGEMAVPFDQGYVCLNVDTQALEENNVSFPTTLEELADEQWRGKTAFPSPTTSSPGRAFMTASIDYFERQSNMDAMEWWEAMADNDAIFTTGWSEAYEIHYSGGYGVWEDGFIGDAWLTVSYCHSPGVEAFFGGNSTISKAVDIDYASFHQVEYAAKVNGGGSASAVDAFIEFLLSNEINTNMPENNYMYSVLEGENLPETDGYRHHSPIPSSPSEITAERIDEEMEIWLMNWREATQSL